MNRSIFTKISLITTLLVSTAILLSQFPANQTLAAGNLTTINYQPSTEDIANPERGFMKQSSIWPDQSFSSSKVQQVELTDTVAWVYFRLDNYRDPRDGPGVVLNNYQGKLLEPLGSGRGLDVIQQTFDTARNKGLKLIIRFIYNWGPGSTNNPDDATPDAPLYFTLQHISQIKPLLIANSDVIAAVQAGFVGHWGEWHSSKYLYTLESRLAILNALLDALPSDRMLQLRYPRYKEIFYGGPLTSDQAFNQSDASRIGHHNDCFLDGNNDGNTYNSQQYETPKPRSTYCDNQSDEVQCWKDFISQEGLYTPIGGESCSDNPPRTDCPNALSELQLLHWSFINNDYNGSVLNRWQSEGCMPEIRRRLGYRFVLSNLIVSDQVNPGGSLPFKLTLTNEGFASPYNPRPVILILKEKTTGYQTEINLTANPRRWSPGQTATIDTQVPIPPTLSQGIYNLYLWLPDPSNNLRPRPEYAIHLANQNVWQASTGYNLLFDNLQVSGSSVLGNGDADGNGIVNPADLKFILQNWSSVPGLSSLDQYSDGKVNALDYSVVTAKLP
jgi:hypothetical protein